ncbi:SsgA family sporulation/cell division regulator [Streptomyces griseoviridis]|uniref:Sporulation protein SsgA n=1 Tax=Streptomyces griseoviridis TaxID=45398 RepID=A0A918LIB2_STRGD|nr:SsgA family sporulation/cell division regulator [Streptomyces niveoruber]GGS55543.1 sporulation protein SsgA [Streptomyces niveoruber]
MNDRSAFAGPGTRGDRVPPVLVTTVRRLFVPAGPDTLRCRLRYTLDDPYAVTLDLFVDPVTDLRVTWVVSRELLDRGTRGPSGEGDFRVRPVGDRYGTAGALRFTLLRPEGRVCLETGLSGVRRWLDATYALVPAGDESRLLDWDALEAALLGRGGRRS